mgnify:CR=1 FL=1
MSTLGAPTNNPGDMLILVDSEDRDLGFLSKEECHRGAGVLHRAFSVFLVNPHGEVLLQQRSGREVSSNEIGELVLLQLREMSEVAYVRFASVYRQFQGVSDFVATLEGLSKPASARSRSRNRLVVVT